MRVPITRRMAVRRLVVAAWISACADGGSARAASLSRRDVQVIVKVLGFLVPAPAGGPVAVLYVAADATSKADALAIVALFGDGLPSSGGTVIARAIDVASLADGAKFIALILAQGTANATFDSQRSLTITAADELVQTGRCVMAVHSQPRVEITVNRAAAAAAGIGFTAAFGMMVHEI